MRKKDKPKEEGRNLYIFNKRIESVSIERNKIIVFKYIYIFLSDLQMIYKWRKISKNNFGKSISKIMKDFFIDCIFIVLNMCIMHISFSNCSNLLIKIYIIA